MSTSVGTNQAVLLAQSKKRPSVKEGVVCVYQKVITNEYGINAEPLVFIISIAYGIIMSTAPILTFWARCVEIYGENTNLRNATHFCGEIIGEDPTKKNESAFVQKDITAMSIYIQLCGSLTSLVGSAILGVYSDYNGRKKPLILSVFSLTVYVALYTLGIFIYDRINIYYVMILAETVVGCFGGVAMTSLILSGIIMDDSRNDLMFSGIPWRVTLNCFGRSVGNILGPIIYTLCAVPISESSEHHVNGIFYTYLIAVGCCVLTLIFSIFFVRETNKNHEFNVQSMSFWEKLRHYLLGTFRVFKSKRVSCTRLCLWLIAGFMFMDDINLDNTLQYLYFRTPPFFWKDENFNKYIVFKTILSTLGVVILPLLLKRFNCVGKESILLMVAIFSNSASLLTISLAKTTAAIYYVGPLFLLGSGTGPGFQTVLSKMVNKEETARLFAFFSMLLAISPLFSKAVFYEIYFLTLATRPSFVFQLIAGLLFATFIGQIVVHFLMRNHWSKVESEATAKLKHNNIQAISS